MRRRSIALIFLLSLACGRRDVKPFPFPEEMPGGWRLKDQAQAGMKSIATYEGFGKVTVKVEDTGSFAVALERAQKTPPERNAVFFNQASYFVTVRWENANREALRQLINKLQNLVK